MTNTQNTTLGPAYLIAGADALKRETVIKRLRRAVSKMGDLSFNYDVFEGTHATGDEIVMACQTMPFASEVRLVQVNDADKLKKADSEKIVSYLASPSSSTVLALLAESLAKNTRLYKAVDKLGAHSVIQCIPKKKRELPAMIRGMAVSHGATMTESAASALLELVGEGTVELNSEVEKLALAHVGADPINENEVRRLVSHTVETKPWEFADAFASRNIQKCFLCLSHMKSVSPYALFGMCVTRIRDLIAVQSLVKRGASDQAISKRIKRPPFAIKGFKSWAQLYSAQELRDALALALEYEKSMKSGGDPDMTFQDWFVAVIRRD